MADRGLSALPERDRIQRREYRVLHRVLNRLHLVPPSQTANRHPQTAREDHSRQVGTSVPAGPPNLYLTLAPSHFAAGVVPIPGLGRLLETDFPTSTFRVRLAERFQGADDGIDDPIMVIQSGMRFAHACFDVG